MEIQAEGGGPDEDGVIGRIEPCRADREAGEATPCDPRLDLLADRSAARYQHGHVGRGGITGALPLHQLPLGALERVDMAPAELARAGALVWVPNGGGQVEIVDERELVFDEEAEAADRIAAAISDPARERRLRDALGARAEGFSTARFIMALRRIVAEFRE